VKAKKDKDTVREILQFHAPDLYREFGIKIAPLILTAAEFRKKSKTPAVRDIIRSGKLVAGRKPEDVLRG
jgi:hypothetical protein